MPDALFLAAGAPTLQVCAKCGTSWPEERIDAACPDCDGLLDVIHAVPAQRGGELRAQFDARASLRADARGGVWRFRELVMPSAIRTISHPEGDTPLLTRSRINEYTGVDTVWLKHEGYNPTGSFKDRGMTVAITHALKAGASAVACASTGNTSASLASYASTAGIPGLVFVPAGQVAAGKLTQALAYGARTLLVKGDFDACLALAREASKELGVHLVNSINPWRIEGQKTTVWELIAQLSWDPPDWIALPSGNLGNLSAFGKALREAKALGLIDRVPRLAAVQAAGAAPFATAFKIGFVTRAPVRAETVATAIKIGDPASWDRAVRAIRETNGVVTAVSDDELLDAKALVDACGVGCEPASAASVAGVRQLAREGVIKRDDRVVCVLTGHLLKDPDTVLKYHAAGSTAARANPPIEIPASLKAVESVLRS